MCACTKRVTYQKDMRKVLAEVYQKLDAKKPPPKRWKRSHQKVGITCKPLLWRPCRVRGALRCQAIPGPLKQGDWVKLKAYQGVEVLDPSLLRNNHPTQSLYVVFLITQLSCSHF
jgi:hypothetical protein